MEFHRRCESMHTTTPTSFRNANRHLLYFIKLLDINSFHRHAGIQKLTPCGASAQTWARKDTGYGRHAPSIYQLE